MSDQPYAPDAIRAAFDLVAKLDPALNVELSGILGDQSHFATGGYHVPRRYVPSTDYSVQLPADRQGDPYAASALDLKPTAAGMITITSRLIAAVEAHDPRLYACREFFGTVNGRSVTGRDVPSGRVVSSDSSHLWHVHISGLREYANDARAWAAIAEVVAGKPIKYGPKDARYTDTMTRDELTKLIDARITRAGQAGIDAVRAEIRAGLQAVEFGGPRGDWTEATAGHLVVDEGAGDRDRLAALESQVAQLLDAAP